ncbi:MAG TPA: LysR family transcriptional regulator [Xanthobacteraceae bacterium]|jgi:DNA-binding transcriptional LysR family regulator|nr:LysR family transcriptional regulator [Xanthobacteraceae bacterium]
MTNIPTELLRTFVAVVDLRGFTKAAQALGCTQPAVSAQIKRLQALLGSELLDKSAPGVVPTERGRAIADCARRLLAINDQIIEIAAIRSSTIPLRIGIPGDFGGAQLPAALAEFRRRSPQQAFHVRCDVSTRLLRGLEQGDLDLAVTFAQHPLLEAFDRWAERVVWVRGPATVYDSTGPVPLVVQDDECVLTKLSVEALDRAGRDWEMVFRGASSASVAAAVAAGLGVSVMVERLVPAELIVWRDPPLPPLPEITCSIYLREGDDRELLEDLAQALAAAIRARPGRGATREPVVDRQAG